MGTLKVNNIQSTTDGSVTFPQGSISSQPVILPSGTASNPSISFTGDTDTGIYRSAANQISLSTAGTERARIDNNGLEIIDGTASNPSLSFLNDSDTGLYRIDANKIGISTGGSKVGEIGVGYGGFTGNVIQLQNSVNSFNQTNTTIGSYSDINSSAGVVWETTITPRYSNSKIILMYSINFVISFSGGSVYCGFAFARKIGSGTYTTIYDSVRDVNGPYTYGIGTGNASSNALYDQGFLIHVDLPATTSTCTYKIMSRPYSSGHTLQLNLAGSQFSGSSYCLLQEVQQ